jgi:recombination protein RecA
MSSLAFSAPTGGTVVFASRKEPALVLQRLAALPKLAGITPASRLEVRPTPEMVSSGIYEINKLTGGLPRGCLSEICGPASSGRTSVLLASLASATRRGEVCALMDATDAFDPVSAAAAGVDFERLLWVQCGLPNKKHDREGHAFSRAKKIHSKERALTSEGKNYKLLERALRVTDLLLQSGSFGLVAIDLGDVPIQTARRIPLTTWFRFQRAVEYTPTVLFVVAQAPCVQTCASLLVRLQASKELSAFGPQHSEKKNLFPTHTQLLEGIRVEGELLRSRMERKPSGSITAAFLTKTQRIS